MTYIIIIMRLTLILASVLQMFYTASTNTIVLTPLYKGKVINSGITPNGSHSESAGLCQKSRHPP